MDAEAAGSAWAEAAELNNRGLSLARRGHYEEAIAAYRQAVKVARSANLPRALATALDNLSVTLAWPGRIAEGLVAHEEALALFRSLDDIEGQSAALSNLAAIRIRAGRPREAVAAQREAVDVCRSGGSREGEGLALSHLGQLLAAEGDEAGAVQAHRDAAAVWRGLGDKEAEAAEHKTLAGRMAETGPPVPNAAMPKVVSVRGCLPFLAAVGAVTTFVLDGPWPAVAVLAAVAVLGWGTCLTSLAALVVGAAVVWEYRGTWWLLGGVALLVFGITSARPRIVRPPAVRAWLGVSTRLDPDEPE